jgi:hypothetical protein
MSTPRHDAMPQSDRLLEQTYDTVNKQSTEAKRVLVARAAALAAQYRAAQLAKIAPARPAKEAK